MSSNPGYQPAYPLIYQTSEYGYENTVDRLLDEENGDSTNVRMQGARPITISVSPTTYTNNDTVANPNKLQQVVYFAGDFNASVSYNNQPIRRGQLYIVLNWLDFITVTFSINIPNVIVLTTTNPGTGNSTQLVQMGFG